MAVSYDPVDLDQAAAVVGVVLKFDPKGDLDCRYCQYKDRYPLDVALLATDAVGDVLEAQGISSSGPKGSAALRGFMADCAAAERHRRKHVIDVFQSLQQGGDFPDKTAPTIHFVDWQLKEYYLTANSECTVKERIAALTAMGAALKLRAEIRGEMINSRKGIRPDETIEAEVLLTEDQRRKQLELEAKRLGLELVPLAIETTAH